MVGVSLVGFSGCKSSPDFPVGSSISEHVYSSALIKDVVKETINALLDPEADVPEPTKVVLGEYCLPITMPTPIYVTTSQVFSLCSSRSCCTYAFQINLT